MEKMIILSVFFLIISFESSMVISNAFNTYCTLPCPFTGPPQPPRSLGAIQMPSRRSSIAARSSFYDAYSDYDELSEGSQPPPMLRSRQIPNSDPQESSSPSKPKPKPPPEDPEPPPKRRSSSSSSPPACPSIQPSRRFFTSLFSIPGAVVDTLISGEIVL